MQRLCKVLLLFFFLFAFSWREAGQGFLGLQDAGGIRVVSDGPQKAWVIFPKDYDRGFRAAFLKDGDLLRPGRVVVLLDEKKGQTLAAPPIFQKGNFFRSIKVYPVDSARVGVFFEPMRPFGFRMLSDRMFFYPWSMGSSKLIRAERIFIDPGHGGKDPGAIGQGGMAEKDLTLALGMVLSEMLKKAGFIVGFTRDQDLYVPLEERVRMAKAFEADLFVSIHTNASTDPRQSGIEAYVLGDPTDQSASWVATRENNGFEASPKSGELKALVEDLNMAATRALSHRFASLAIDKVSGALEEGPRSIRVKQAPFVVLHGLGIPAFLIEVGFLTNPMEESRLCSKAFQSLTAKALVEAIGVLKDDDAWLGQY
mgnify:CR=1 FL=1